MLFASCFLFFSHFPETSFSATNKARRPNSIVFFTDDQGYGDVGSFGSPNIRTPNLDRLAAEGAKFRSFYAQQVCGPSRAALLTGSYPIRVAEPENRKNPNTTLHGSAQRLLEARLSPWQAINGGSGGSRPRYVDEVPEHQLFHLGTDVAETQNLADERPEIVRKLSEFSERARQELGDYDRIGRGARFFDEGPKRPGMDTL